MCPGNVRQSSGKAPADLTIWVKKTGLIFVIDAFITISERFLNFFLVKLERNANLAVIETVETIIEMKVS